MHENFMCLLDTFDKMQLKYEEDKNQNDHIPLKLKGFITSQ